MSTEISQDSNSPEMNTANTRLEIAAEADSRLRQESSKQYSVENSLQWMKATSAELFAPVRDAMIILFRQNRGLLVILGWALLVLVGLRILSALLDAINDIPLIPLILELVGMAYVGWFVYRYLMKSNTRQELVQQIDQIKQDILGDPTGDTVRNTSVGNTSGIDVKRSVVINKSPEELYQFWRNFENLPRFMNHIESVQVLDDKRSHWVAKAPLNTNVEWDAEIIDEVENKTIVWRSLEGAEVDSVGSVAFTSANGSGTEVKVTMEYNPPGGEVGAFAAELFGENPQQQLDEDLNRFKQLMETGSVPAAS